MSDDKLTRPECVRLEALAQAIAFYAAVDLSGFVPPMSDVIERAEEIEQWLYKAKDY